MRKVCETKFWKETNFLKIILGNINLFSSGRVEEGFFEGAYVGEVASYLNDDPNACHSKTGLTLLRSNYLSIVFEKKGKIIACTGCSTYNFSPV